MEFGMQGDIKEMGIKVIKILYELEFSEDEFEDILNTNTKYTAYLKLIEKRMEGKKKR